MLAPIWGWSFNKKKMSFRYFSPRDWSSCTRVESLSDSGRIETWEFVGKTSDFDWDLDFGGYEVLPPSAIMKLGRGTGPYIVLRNPSKPFAPAYLLTLQANGELARGGSRFKFRCVDKRKSPAKKKTSVGKGKGKSRGGKKAKSKSPQRK